MFTPTHAQQALHSVLPKFGKERTQLLEKIMRLETNHFRSKQYQRTGSAGMEDGAWGTQVKKYMPTGYSTITMNDNHPAERGKSQVRFVVWASVEAFLYFLNDYINRHQGNYARWNSLDAQRQQQYRLKINRIMPQFII